MTKKDDKNQGKQISKNLFQPIQKPAISENLAWMKELQPPDLNS